MLKNRTNYGTLDKGSKEMICLVKHWKGFVDVCLLINQR